MNTNYLKKLLAFSLILSFAGTALGFSPETHIYVSQEALKDINEDFVEIDGKQYRVHDPAVIRAIKKYPKYFFVGSVGPDAFPDLVTGQTTTHPGIENGWSTDDFLKHLVNTAKTEKEIAFAYGFLSHAAGDVYAHSYVNQFAGDTFELGDEQDVELRHFLVEKYIGQHTPAIGMSELKDYNIPKKFVREQLILSDKVQKQYKKVPIYTGHLIAMATIHKKISQMETILTKIDKAIRVVVKPLEAIVGKLNATLAKAVLKLTNISKDLKLKHLNLAKIQKKIPISKGQIKKVNAKLSALAKKLAATEKNIRQGALSQKNIKAAKRKLIDKKNYATKQLKKARNAVNSYAKKLRNTRKNVKQEFCENRRIKTKWGPLKIPRWITKNVCWADTVVSKAWKNAKKKLTASKKKFNKVRSNTNAKITSLNKQIGARNADYKKVAARIVKLRKSITNTKKVQAVANNEIRILKNNIRVASGQLVNLRKRITNVSRLKKEATAAIGKTDAEIKRIAEQIRSSEVSLKFGSLVKRWREDVEEAIDAYTAVGSQAAYNFVARKGGTVSAYTDWYACWGPAFQAVPNELNGLNCKALNAYHKLAAGYQEFSNKLGIWGWVVAPQGKIGELLMAEIKKELIKAGLRLADHINSRSLAQMLLLMSTKQAVTATDLEEAFTRDNSGKGLLHLPEIVDMLHADMHASNGTFDKEQFAIVANAIRLVKLSFVEVSDLSRLEEAESGSSSEFLAMLKPNRAPDSFMFDWIKSIDGSFQWQSVAPAFPRQDGKCDHGWPHARRYSTFAGDHNAKITLNIWLDRFVNEQNYAKIFKGPLSPSLIEHLDTNNNRPYIFGEEVASGQINSIDTTSISYDDYFDSCQ